MKRLVHWFILLIILVPAFDAGVMAQFPQRTPTPNDTLVSPRLLPGNHVLISIYAPKATDVSIVGDFLSEYKPLPLSRQESGVWSTTLGPLEPDLYTYDLTVDGVKTLDPRNASIKEGLGAPSNLFEVPGPESAFMEMRDVPHGMVAAVWYPSSSLGTIRRMHVYLPPVYETRGKKLPVLYLLHGGGDTDAGWSTIGRANVILDNLLAEGKIEPMIVVMPAGHTPVPGLHMGAGPDQDPFSKDLLVDIIPFVERHFNVATGPDHRAISGLSMGGIQTLNIGLFNPDKFGYVIAMSTGYFPPALGEMEKSYATALKNPALNRLKLFQIMIGTADFANPNNKNTMALLDKFGVKYTYVETDGGHTWLNWRRYLRDFAPLLFR